jgi:hypothetical protein
MQLDFDSEKKKEKKKKKIVPTYHVCSAFYDPTFDREMFIGEAGFSYSQLAFFVCFIFSFRWYHYFSLLLNFRDLI